MRTIKRYGNRKLYDTQEKRYLTLAHLSELVAQGEKVKVVDNQTGAEITGVVLSKALIDKEKESGGFLPTELFSNLLQGANLLKGAPEKVLGYLRKSWTHLPDQVKDLRGEVDKRLRPLIERGKLSAKDALHFRDQLMEGLRTYWHDLEAQIESRVASALEAMPLVSRREVERLEKRIADLGSRIERLSGPRKTASRAAARSPRGRPAARGRARG